MDTQSFDDARSEIAEVHFSVNVPATAAGTGTGTTSATNSGTRPPPRPGLEQYRSSREGMRSSTRNLLDPSAIKENKRRQRKAAIENFELHTKNDNNNHNESCVSKWSLFRTSCGKLVNSKPVQVLVVILICIDAAILGAFTFDQIHDHPIVYKVLNGIDFSCLMIFNVEIALQITYLGPYNLLFFAPWRMFDFIVIVLSWAFYRKFRALGVFRLFTAVSKLDMLRTLFIAVGRTLPKMASIWIMLLVFFYVFSVLFTSLYSNAYEEGGHLEFKYFGNLKHTALTLFQMMTLDSWSELMRKLMETDPSAWVGFIVWIIITAFFFLNMLIAVICDALRELGEIEQRKREKRLEHKQNALFKNQERKIHDELERDRQIQALILEQQRITQTLLLDVLKAVSPHHPSIVAMEQFNTAMGNSSNNSRTDHLHRGEPALTPATTLDDKIPEELEETTTTDDYYQHHYPHREGDFDMMDVTARIEDLSQLASILQARPHNASLNHNSSFNNHHQDADDSEGTKNFTRR